jgi:hypothetical protein
MFAPESPMLCSIRRRTQMHVAIRCALCQRNFASPFRSLSAAQRVRDSHEALCIASAPVHFAAGHPARCTAPDPVVYTSQPEQSPPTCRACLAHAGCQVCGDADADQSPCDTCELDAHAKRLASQAA